MQQNGSPKTNMDIEVTTTSWGLYSLNTGHWSDIAVITVSNAPNIDPRARVINIRKNKADQTWEPGILINTYIHNIKILIIWLKLEVLASFKSYQGIARTQSPTNKNYAFELPTFGVIVGVSPTEVQWRGLTLEEPPSWSRLTSTPGKYASNLSLNETSVISRNTLFALCYKLLLKKIH